MHSQSIPIPLKTPTVARELGVTYNVIVGLIRFNKLNPLPAKDSSGDYVWLPADLDRARELLAKNPPHRKPSTTNNPSTKKAAN